MKVVIGPFGDEIPLLLRKAVVTSGAAADDWGNMSHMLLKALCCKPSGLCHHRHWHGHQQQHPSHQD